MAVVFLCLVLISLKATLVLSHGSAVEQRFSLVPVSIVLMGSLILYFKDDKIIHQALTCVTCILVMMCVIAKIAGVF